MRHNSYCSAHLCLRHAESHYGLHGRYALQESSKFEKLSEELTQMIGPSSHMSRTWKANFEIQRSGIPDRSGPSLSISQHRFWDCNACHLPEDDLALKPVRAANLKQDWLRWLLHPLIHSLILCFSRPTLLEADTHRVSFGFTAVRHASIRTLPTG